MSFAHDTRVLSPLSGCSISLTLLNNLVLVESSGGGTIPMTTQSILALEDLKILKGLEPTEERCQGFATKEMEIRGIFVADKTANLLGRPGTCPKQGTTFATRDVLGATSEIFLSPRSRIVKSSLQKSSVFITAGGFRSVPSGSDES